jgi:perosamine synthetase
MALASEHGLVVIEDGCHALGASLGGRRVGSVADMTAFSFHPVKHVAAGEGGMVTTNNPKLAQSLRRFRNHGIDTDAQQRQATGNWVYQMVELGTNCRLSDIACALGLSQLRKLESNLGRRRAIAERYAKAFRNVPAITPITVRDGAECAWHLYPVLLDLNRLSVGRAETFRALRAENIGVNVHYIPIHLHRYYVERFGDHKGEYPIAENAYERLISLPIFHAMTDQDVDDVITAVQRVVVAYSR